MYWEKRDLKLTAPAQIEIKGAFYNKVLNSGLFVFFPPSGPICQMHRTRFEKATGPLKALRVHLMIVIYFIKCILQQFHERLARYKAV